MKRVLLLLLIGTSVVLGASTQIREGTQTQGALPTAQGGVKTGGTTGQVLAKASNSDYDLLWSSAGAGTVIATGGSLTSNSVVLGAGTTDTKVSTGIITDGASKLILGLNTSTLGQIKLFGNTSGDATIQPAAAAGTSTVVTLPNASSTLPIFGQQVTFTGPTAARSIALPDAAFTVARTDAANTFTGHQTVEGVTSTGATGTGKFVFDTAPQISTIDLGAASDTTVARSGAGEVTIEGKQIPLVGNIKTTQGQSSSGTATTVIAQLTASASHKFVCVNAVGSHPSVTGTSLKMIYTFSDTTTVSITSTAVTNSTVCGNDSGIVGPAATAEVSAAGKLITDIRIETAGTGTGARGGIISAIEVPQ